MLGVNNGDIIMTLAQINNENLADSDLEQLLDLKTTDFENTLNVYQDKNNNWLYNLNQSTTLSVDESLILTYTCQYDSHWPLISYNLYGTTRLAWMLYKLNDININNIFKPILAGDKIKYIQKSFIRTIINSLQDYNTI